MEKLGEITYSGEYIYAISRFQLKKFIDKSWRSRFNENIPKSKSRLDTKMICSSETVAVSRRHDFSRNLNILLNSDYSTDERLQAREVVLKYLIKRRSTEFSRGCQEFIDSIQLSNQVHKKRKYSTCYLGLRNRELSSKNIVHWWFDLRILSLIYVAMFYYIAIN